MDEQTRGPAGGCGCGAGAGAGPAGVAQAPPGTRGGSVAGWALLAAACALAAGAGALSAWLWPAAFGLAWLGGWQLVRVRGCGVGGDPTQEDSRQEASAAGAAGLSRSQRGARARQGGVFLVLGAGLALLAALGWALLWPLAALALWFGASFEVAAATGYAGCPEVGAIASWLLRRPIATRCPPLERLEGPKDGRTAELAGRS